MCATSMSDADDRELCVLSILRMEISASTKRIIELASTPEFERIRLVIARVELKLTRPP